MYSTGNTSLLTSNGKCMFHGNARGGKRLGPELSL
jgi:hypothetical protein